MITVFGHKNPDTDAITSALVYAHFLRALGEEAQAISLGDLNKETLFVLEQAQCELPDKMTTLPSGSQVALVDHNESGQSIDDLHTYSIHSVVDHHKLGDLQTSLPVFLRFEPLASTNSVLYKLYTEYEIEIDRQIATLMLGGIVSDTLNLRSPTTTDFERSLIPLLAKLAHRENVDEFAQTMFEKKSDLGDISAYDLVKNVDAKDFSFGDKKVLIACIETTNPSYCLARKSEIVDTLHQLKTNEGYDCALFCTIDIVNETNETIVADESDASIVKKAFGSETTDNIAHLGNRISRKKTIVPSLQKTFE